MGFLINVTVVLHVLTVTVYLVLLLISNCYLVLL